ncbi:hypothetical protein [Clostridium prolinivorans]|uniref:hypothetical protein n=1 Tax=Clostridium prolinivorans TaxID=2769420 RepID=UPI000FD8D01C|nr:hypothetical protein [Clostridium prolinivorans]
MKVFYLDKPTDKDYNSFFRSSDNIINVSKICIEENFPFKYLTINNTKDSNYILSLYSIKLKTKDDNTATLFMGENLVLEENLKEIDNFKIGHKVNFEDTSSYIELYSVKTYSKNPVDLLDNHYILMIPGGSVIIKFDIEIYNVELTLNSLIQKI